jgi:hypothetical protein
MTNPTEHARFGRTAALAVAALLVLSVLGPVGTAAAAGQTAVTVSAADDAIAVGETTTVDVVVDSDGGVSAAELGVELDDPSVASITDVSISGAPSTKQVDVAADGSSASVAYFGVSTPDAGAVTVVTVTVEAEAPGETGISVTPRTDNDDVVLFDKQGAPYTVTGVGSAALTVTEADDGGDANSPPTADAGSDATVDEGTSAQLDASGSEDADGSIASYSWTQVDGPSVSLSDASTAAPTFTAPDVGDAQTLVFEVTVTDDDGASDVDTVSVTVTPTDDDPSTPDPPSDGDGLETELTLSPADQTVPSGSTTTVDVVVESADGGVGAGAFAVSVDDPSVASITAVDVQGGPAGQFVESSVAADGGSATVEYATADTADSGSVPVVTLTLEGASTGSASVSIDDASLYDEAGAPYAVTGTSGASVTVENPPFFLSALDGPSTLTTDESGTVSATVTNGGAVSATKSVALTVDGQTVATEQVTLDAGESATVEFTLTGGDVGTVSYTVSTADDSISGEVAVTLPVVGNSEGPPADLDGDGLYEDVNGDGTVDVGDVQTLFAHDEEDAIQDHVAAFDFNGDGTVDVGDVQTLFAQQAL